MLIGRLARRSRQRIARKPMLPRQTTFPRDMVIVPSARRSCEIRDRPWCMRSLLRRRSSRCRRLHMSTRQPPTTCRRRIAAGLSARRWCESLRWPLHTRPRPRPLRTSHPHISSTLCWPFLPRILRPRTSRTSPDQQVGLRYLARNPRRAATSRVRPQMCLHRLASFRARTTCTS